MSSCVISALYTVGDIQCAKLILALYPVNYVKKFLSGQCLSYTVKCSGPQCSNLEAGVRLYMLIAREMGNAKFSFLRLYLYRGADKSLARPGRKQANVSVRMECISFGALPCRKKELGDSSRLDFVEIARVPHELPSLFPF